jgi:hypothetical protein
MIPDWGMAWILSPSNSMMYILYYRKKKDKKDLSGHSENHIFTRLAAGLQQWVTRWLKLMPEIQSFTEQLIVVIAKSIYRLMNLYGMEQMKK